MTDSPEVLLELPAAARIEAKLTCSVCRDYWGVVELELGTTSDAIWGFVKPTRILRYAKCHCGAC